ncbi:hypothetical protein L2D01_00405 [Hyphomonadaceae bacterium ML37]|nr:hypothetical protein L2D01_00405 [Hyphomonadaceae bacterium ML37]
MSHDAKLALLPHLDHAAILKVYQDAPGDELGSGKFNNPASSAALAANVFGYFLTDPSACDLSIAGAPGEGVRTVALEAVVRFGWRGGRHPCLDALVAGDDWLVGVEAKRYEPFRAKSAARFSSAFDRDVWGALPGWNDVRRKLQGGDLRFAMLDAAQLIKHALALSEEGRRTGRDWRLIYTYAEPGAWPDGRLIDARRHHAHRAEIDRFAAALGADAARFHAVSYRALLSSWADQELRAGKHARAVLEAFDL